MLWRDNEGKNPTTENGNPEVKAENIHIENNSTQSVMERIEALKKQMDELKKKNRDFSEQYNVTPEEADRAASVYRNRAERNAERNTDRNAVLIEKAKKQSIRRKAIDQQLKVAVQNAEDKEQKKQQVAKIRKQLEHSKRQERQKLIEQQRAIQRQIRNEALAEERRLKAELNDLKKAERAEKHGIGFIDRKTKAERDSIRRQRKLAKKSAEMGGGIVNVHGTTISTEIRPVAKYSFRDLFGISKRRARKQADSALEMKQILEESEKRKEKSRQIAAQLSQLQWERRKNSILGQQIIRFLDFCEYNKKPLLVTFSILLILGVGAAGIFNYFTLYEYSYGGKALGYVKDKDDVLQVTDLVQNALNTDSDMDVVIDAKDDISFDRKFTFGKDYTADSTDDVLKRLTYISNLNVKAYGIYVDGKKAGAVEDKDTAANVLKDIEAKYASKKSGTTIEDAVILEDVKVRQSNTKMQDVLSEDQMVSALTKDRNVESVHTVVAGETLATIAEDYGIKEKLLRKTNPNVDPNNLVVGSTVVIKETAPLLTVQITEVRTYEKTIKYKTEKKKDKTMYEGYSEVKQKGENGLSELTDRTLSVNGEVVKTDNLKTVVKKKAVAKIVNVGTKYRPPTVGSGKIRWPADKDDYVVTSEYKWRWGRQHQGIDLGCSVGTDVLAADGGTVTYAGYMGGYGNLVIIDHQNGMQTYYGHNTSLCVKEGDKVFKGQHIAEAGSTGNSTGPHIHFGVMIDGSFVNPREYLPDNGK